MQSKELLEIRHRFEKAETETDPERKCSFLEEALDLVDDLQSDLPADSPDIVIAHNLRQSHLHRLLVQLIAMRKIQINAWLNYIKLFFLRVNPVVMSILASEPALQEAYNEFTDLWWDEFETAAKSRLRHAGRIPEA